jgi:hypothetical protein
MGDPQVRRDGARSARYLTSRDRAKGRTFHAYAGLGPLWPAPLDLEKSEHPWPAAMRNTGKFSAFLNALGPRSIPRSEEK